MSTLVYRINPLLCRVLKGVPLGTNVGLFYLLWTLLSGCLLASRGALTPALADFGLDEKAVRRSWASLRYGKWTIQPMIEAFKEVVDEEGQWQPHRYGGMRVVACDLVGFYRPHLKECPGKHYSSEAGKALPAIVFGLMVEVGSVGEQRVPILRAIVRTPLDQPKGGEQEDGGEQKDGGEQEDGGEQKGTERAAKISLLKKVAELLQDDQVLIADAGFELSSIQAAGIRQYVVRIRNNFTARRATLPEYKGTGRPPVKGELVRPLPRTRAKKGANDQEKNRIEATPPDERVEWTVTTHEGRVKTTFRAEIWKNLVLPDGKPGDPIFEIVAIYAPGYEQPLLLGMAPGWQAGVAREFYLDRWPVEQVPLSAKQMIGACRSFVSAEESCQRMPELSLLAGSILSYMAATAPVVSTGYWDKRPRATPGRFRRALSRVSFKELQGLPQEFRKKRSKTEHLPKGVEAHRRTKAEKSASKPTLPHQMAA